MRKGSFLVTDPMSLHSENIRKHNLFKYRIISAILDYFAFNEYAEQNTSDGKQYDIDEIRNAFISDGLLSSSTTDTADFNLIISQMVYMKLIGKNRSIIYPTTETYKAFSEQKFHQIFASLLAAEDSRKLNKTAIIISSLALIVAIISLIK